MRLVKQQHAMGCGVACVAMILGETYEDACRHFPGVDFETRGIVYLQVDSLLMDRGYAVRRMYRQTHQYIDRPLWPPTPFAAQHVCQVVIGQNCHFVVMDSGGIVLDPLKDLVGSLFDYEKVNQVMGLYLISAAERGGE